MAARSGCLDCVKALVEAGADVNAKTKDGKTPLHLARGNAKWLIISWRTASSCQRQPRSRRSWLPPT
ncbi:ankyrin repeat domain-containing protein [Mesorhizobium sp.]|uniref:ankyrin repeat domain-containing protein n=1 Tax=Mesorhizobium sp. TaxID=1871066 RepID=UPI002580AF1E|nr:ankyrin repeat domain-containing protein [Mesorhizobium sp.]